MSAQVPLPPHPDDAAGRQIHTPLPRASVPDTLAVIGQVVLPLVARGVIARRPRVVGLEQRMDADRRAVRRLQRLRDRHGAGPVLLAVPGRRMALVLDPDDVRRVLDGSPDPFATATLEKRGALSHFQPHGVLVSDAAARAERRPFNAAVLDEPHPVHGMADDLVPKVRQEAALLVESARRDGRLTWDDFITAWWRAVRRIVLGDAARDDHALTDLLTQLRHDANWSGLRPRRRGLRDRFDRQLRGHLDRAEPGSLAALVDALPTTPVTEPAQQVPQWLFAFDPAGMAAFRGLALLAAHPEQAGRVRQELAGRDLSTPQDLPLHRATVLESLRLWPTTPAILRDTTRDTQWAAGTLPAGSGLLIFAPLFHRDDRALPYAHRFAPDVWLADRGDDDWPLVPFSAGPAACPGRNLVLLTTSTMLATLLDGLEVRLDPPGQLDADAPLPGTFSPYQLRFSARKAAPAQP